MFNRVRYIDAPCPDNVLRLDNAALPMIASMHRNGVRLDVPFLRSMSQEIAQRQSELVDLIQGYIGDYQYRHSKHGLMPFQVGSRDHLSQLLFEHLKIQGDDVLAMTPKGKRFEVSQDVLEPFKKRHPIVNPILEWHEVEKVRNTYVDVMPNLVDSESRLHTTFNVTIAATGRLSSSKVNLQNIPVRSKIGRKVRNAFIPSPGCLLLQADLSQAEMRWACHGSSDPAMMEVFFRDEDIHAKTACGIFGRDYADVMSWPKDSEKFIRWKKEERAPSKNLGFGVLYGLTAPGLRRNILTESEGEVDWDEAKCQGFINQFFALYPRLREFLDLQYRRARRYGLVWDAFARVRLVPEARSAFKHISNEGERKAGNHYEQASSQGTIKLAMGELHGVLEDVNRSYKCLPLIQIHDALLLDVDKRVVEEVAVMVQGVMERASPMRVPMLSSSDYGENWGVL